MTKFAVHRTIPAVQSEFGRGCTAIRSGVRLSKSVKRTLVLAFNLFATARIRTGDALVRAQRYGTRTGASSSGAEANVRRTSANRSRCRGHLHRRGARGRRSPVHFESADDPQGPRARLHAVHRGNPEPRRPRVGRRRRHHSRHHPGHQFNHRAQGRHHVTSHHGRVPGYPPDGHRRASRSVRHQRDATGAAGAETPADHRRGTAEQSW